MLIFILLMFRKKYFTMLTLIFSFFLDLVSMNLLRAVIWHFAGKGCSCSREGWRGRKREWGREKNRLPGKISFPLQCIIKYGCSDHQLPVLKVKEFYILMNFIPNYANNQSVCPCTSASSRNMQGLNKNYLLGKCIYHLW